MSTFNTTIATGRKIILFLFFALLSLGILSNCSKREDTPTPPISATEGQPTETPIRSTQDILTEVVQHTAIQATKSTIQDQLEGITIEMWHPWLGTTGETIKQLTDEFNQENQWGMKVELRQTGSYDSLYRLVDEAVELGEKPDLVIAFPHQLEFRKELWSVQDLNVLLNDPMFGYPTETTKEFHAGMWKQGLSGDQRLGIPAYITVMGMFYNQTWASELGFDHPPENTEQFKRQACEASLANLADKNRSNDGTGGWLISTDPTVSLGWIYAFGGEIVLPDNQGYSFGTQAVIDAFTFQRQLFDDGCAWLSSNQSPEIELAQRRALFVSASTAHIASQSAGFEREGNNDEWTVIAYPSTREQGLVVGFSPHFGIITDDENRRLGAWLFIKWLLDSDHQMDLADSAGSLPLGDSDQGLDGRNEKQWIEAGKLIDLILSEPNLSSWRLVKWALHDAVTQLFRSYFSEELIVPELVPLLEITARELHTLDNE